MGGPRPGHERRRRGRGISQPHAHPAERAVLASGVRPRAAGLQPHRLADAQLHRRQLRRRLLRDAGGARPRVHRDGQPGRRGLHLVHHGVRCRRRRVRHPQLRRAARRRHGHRRRRQLRDPPRRPAGGAQLARDPAGRRAHHHPALLRVAALGVGVADAARADQHSRSSTRRRRRRGGTTTAWPPPCSTSSTTSTTRRSAQPPRPAGPPAPFVSITPNDFPRARRAGQHGLRRVRRRVLDGAVPDRPRRGAGHHRSLAGVPLRQRVPLEPLVADVRLREPAGEPNRANTTSSPTAASA